MKDLKDVMNDFKNFYGLTIVHGMIDVIFKNKKCITCNYGSCWLFKKCQDVFVGMFNLMNDACIL
jgi:hypothetical protein